MTRPGENGAVAGDASEASTRALTRLVDRCLRHMERLDGRLNALAEAVARLDNGPAPGATSGVQTSAAAAPKQDSAAAGPAGPGVRSWLLADDAEQAAADLDDLVRWVWQVYLWFPRTSLPACWLWHPAVIEELWCLRVAHADAFDEPTRSVLRVADWHERLRPGAVARIDKELMTCQLHRHVPFNGRPVEILPPDPPPLAHRAGAIAGVWTAGAGVAAIHAAGPEPSPTDLAEAEAAQDRQYGRRR